MLSYRVFAGASPILKQELKLMKRRDLLKGMMSAPFLAQGAGAQAEQDQKFAWPPHPHETTGERMPNILWICPDSQRFDTIEGLNNSYIRTPNVRKLTQEGVTFTNTFVQTPICAPSRASFLSSRYAQITGLRANGQRIRADQRLVTKILAEAGYECALVGKLHLSPCQDGRIEDRIDDGYDAFFWSHDTSDQWPGRNMWRVWLESQGVTWPSAPPHTIAWGVPRDPKYTQTAWCADKTIELIRAQNDFQPWLISVNIFQPHHPFHPTEEYFQHYDPAKMPPPAYREGELGTKSLYANIDHQGAYGGTGDSFAKTDDLTHHKVTAAYYAMIEEVDAAVGRMLDALKETGQEENTIVVYMSDHGEMLGDHGIYCKGPYFYEPLTRVPLIMRWPGKYKAGLQADALVEMTDLAPTLLEAAGIPVPQGMQGQSLSKLLTGDTNEHRDSVFCGFYDACAIYDTPPWATMVRTRTHKLSVYHSLKGFGELYDLRNDPGEFDNLWDHPSARPVREELSELLITRLANTIDPLPVRHCMW